MSPNVRLDCRGWPQRFAPLLVEAARPCRHGVGDRWCVDETYLKVDGVWLNLYRAIDQFRPRQRQADRRRAPHVRPGCQRVRVGRVVDVYLSPRRDTRTSRGRGKQVWEWDELRRFLEVSDQTEWAAFWLLLAGTGCRRGEALGIFRTDVDVDGYTVTFQRGLADPGPYLDETKTDASRRTVDITPDVVAALREWKKKQKELEPRSPGRG